MLALAAELDTEGRFRKSANPRIMLEVLLLRFAYLDRTIALEELLRAAGGAPAPEALARPVEPPPSARPAAEAGPRRTGRRADDPPAEPPGAEAPTAPRRAERGEQPEAPSAAL